MNANKIRLGIINLMLSRGEEPIVMLAIENHNADIVSFNDNGNIWIGYPDTGRWLSDNELIEIWCRYCDMRQCITL